MSERKEMSTEMRSLLAAVLCLVVIAGWSLIYKPPQPPTPNPAAVTTNPVAPPPGASSTSTPGAVKVAAPAAPVTMRGASAESKEFWLTMVFYLKELANCSNNTHRDGLNVLASFRPTDAMPRRSLEAP